MTMRDVLLARRPERSEGETPSFASLRMTTPMKLSFTVAFLCVAACGTSTEPPNHRAVRMVIAGNANACALRGDSTTVCWGIVAPGQPSRAPWTVDSTRKFVTLSLGTQFGCGLTSVGQA